MSHKSILLRSVSAVALASVAGAAAQAQDTMVPDGFTVSVEGGALFGPNTVAEDKLGSGGGDGVVNIQDNLGYRAAISLGKQIDPFWDLRVTAAINQQMTSTSDVSFSSGSGGFYGTLETDFDYETMDFEAGYRPMLTDKLDLRFFAGLRGLHYKDSMDKMGAEFSGGGDKVGYGMDFSQEFFGVGPRLGVEASTRLGDSMFGVSGMLAGAALFGTARTEGEITAFQFGSGGSGGAVILPVPGEEEQITVFNLEAALGLDMHVDEKTTVTIGYRAEGLFGIENSISGGSGGSDSRWSHGPTIKLTGNF